MQTNTTNYLTNISINMDEAHLISILVRDNQRNCFKNYTENFFNIVSRIVSATLPILLIAIVFTNLAQAQSQSSIYGQTPAGITPGTPAGSYSLSNVESINLYSGRVNATVPLLKIGGRGGAGYTMMVPIDQSSWVTDFSPYSELFNDGGHMSVLDSQSERLVWGKPPILEPGFLTQRTTLAEPWNVNPDDPGGPNAWKHGITKIVFVSANGTEHFFYDELAGGIPTTWDDFNQQYSPSLLRGHIFSAKDGSGLTFISDDELQINNLFQTSSGNNQPTIENYPSGYLKTQDGTVYRFVNGHAQWVRDRNGNMMTFTYETLTNYPFARLIKITDSIGREVNISYGSTIQITYQGFNGVSRTITLGYNSLSNCLRPNSGYQTGPRYQIFPAYLYNGHTTSFSNANDVYNPTVLSTVTLPDGRYYRFYYNPYGELARMESPTGAAIEYEYGLGANGDSNNPAYASGQIGGIPQYRNNPNVAIYRRLKERREYTNGGSTVTKKTLYSLFDTSLSKVEVEEIDPNGNNVLVRSYHYFNGNPWAKLFTGAELGYPLTPLEGKEIKTESLDVSNNAVLMRVEYEWNVGCYVARSECGTNSYQPLPWSPFLERIKSSTLDTSTNQYQVSKKEYNYDKYNNVTDIYEYDFGNGTLSQYPIRHSHTDYLTTNNSIDYTSANIHLRNLSVRQWVKGYDANGQEQSIYASYSEMLYDEPSYPPFTYSSVIGWTDPSTSARGNVTTARTWLNTNNSYIETHTQYDQLGNVRKYWDANENVSTIDYTDRFGTPDGEAQANIPPSQLNGQNTFAFATSFTNAKGWITGYLQVDYFTGATVDSEDINGVVDTTFYNDILGRPTQMISANNIANSRHQKTIVYDDANQKVTTTADLFSFNDNLSKSEEYRDKLGKILEIRSYKPDGDYITTLMEYDALGNVKRATSPFSPIQNETPLWSKTKYDSLGRTIEVETPDGTKSLTTYSGNKVTTTDRANRQRRSIFNALGQLIRVDEPNELGEVGDVDNPHQPTFYKYNTNGQQVEVIQGNQNRYFMYDSLGRLLRIRQPEQEINSTLNTTANPNNNVWTAGFNYDSNGNILTATDAKGITITRTYDNLNRTLTQTYSDGTPTVTYTYDESHVPFSKGRLTQVANSISTSRTNAFDVQGRQLIYQQITDGIAYTSSYQYNLNGILVQENYPTGRIVRNDFGIDGKLMRVSGEFNGQTKTYANSINYLATGAIERMKLGNELWETTKYNSRQQITELGLGHSSDNSSTWKVNYEYGKIEDDGSLNDLKNTSNIARQTINFQGLTQPFIQTYKYDSLNRLIEAKEVSNNQQNWKQNWTYDRYGNRISFSQIVGTEQLPINNLTNPSIDSLTNRFNAGQGYVYDKNGNLIQNAQGQTFTFNGDNKQILVKDSNQNIIGYYYYDGEGKRVKKVTNSETTVFVYSNGKVVAEYSTQTPQRPQTSYLTLDNLGSPRVITNQNGEIVSRRDFMPFGEELYAGIGERSTAFKYSLTGQDNIRQRFTGYQKDTETNLDYAEARYYYNQHGRFTAVDALLGSGKSTNPQTFNRYVYVINNPLLRIDANGLQPSELSFSAFVEIVAKNFGSVTNKDNLTGPITRETIEQVAKILYPQAQEIYRVAYNAQRALIRSKSNDGVSATSETAKTTRNETVTPATTTTSGTVVTAETSSDTTIGTNGSATGGTDKVSGTGGMTGAVRTAQKVAGTLTSSTTKPTSPQESAAVQITVSDKASPEQQRAVALEAVDKAATPLATQIVSTVSYGVPILYGPPPPGSNARAPIPVNAGLKFAIKPEINNTVIRVTDTLNGVVTFAEQMAGAVPAPPQRVPPPPPPPQPTPQP